MAHVQSLGLHEPAALSYLVDEGLLPDRSSGTSYTWRIDPVYGDLGEEVTEDEILQTRDCVVWARGGIVKRAFNVGVENEEILGSFLTRFPASRGLDCSQNLTASPRATEKRSSNLAGEGPSRTPVSDEQSIGQALVVILKTKAHVYFLTGDTHIISMPFEVESAFPTPQGCLLQRKASPTLANGATLSAPQNSFVSSQLSSSLIKSQQITLKPASSSRPSLTLSPVAPNPVVPVVPQNAFVPSVFSLTDPQADLGVAVTQRQPHAAARSTAEDGEQPFDPAEELLYVSRSDELALLGISTLEPLLLAATRNVKLGTQTLWQAQYKDRDSQQSPRKRRKVSHEGPGSRRRSSARFRVNGSATPIGRGLGESRESLGSQLGSSFPEMRLPHQREEQKASEVENLATELGPDFADSGVQTRAARRVSSMLARTDLSMGPDRAPINGFASNNPGRKSLNRGGTRGESIGDFRDRQSFGARPSSPQPGIGSFASLETSFVAPPIDRLLEGLNSGGEFEGFENMVLEETMSELPAEVIFTKVHTIPSLNPVPINQLSKPCSSVFTLPARRSTETGKGAMAVVSVCIMDREKRELCVIRVEVTSKRKKSKSRTATTATSLKLAAVNLQRDTNIIDACKIRDGDHTCMLALAQKRDGQTALLLGAVGIASIKIDLPNPLMIHDPFAVSGASHSDRRREGGRSRILKGPLRSITGLENASVWGRVDLVDPKANRHRLQIQLEPKDWEVKKILETTEFALQDKGGNGIYIAWIEVVRWLRMKGGVERIEWSAMVITLFSMIIPYVPDKRDKGRIGAKPKKAGLLRSSSGATIDMRHWNEMVDEESGVGATSPAWTTSPAWHWTGCETDSSKPPAGQRYSLKPIRSTASEATFVGKTNVFLPQCVSWTREFMQTAVGDRMLGPDGFLLNAPNGNRKSRWTAVGTVLVALHLLREEQKLDVRLSRSGHDGVQLASVLAQIGHWLNWQSWGFGADCFYRAELPDVEQQLFDDNKINSSDLIPQPFIPASIFEFVESSLSGFHARSFPTLLDLHGNRDQAGPNSLMSRANSLTPRTFALLKYFSGSASLQIRPARVEWMAQCGVDAELMATLPIGVSASFYDAVCSCEGSPPSSWSEPLLQLIGRDDLIMRPKPSNSQATTSKPRTITGHEAIRDYHGIGNSILDTEASHSWDASSEADRQSVTRLVFRNDRRFQDASRLVNQMRAPIAECHPEPDWTEADLLDAQKELVQLIIMRTLTVASGRGMINYSSRVPLLTERVPISAFTLQCQVRPSNVTFTAEKASFTEERAVWAFFHNGTAAGLTISKEAKGIDTSWILYNKPPELTNRHAGFLLALGLNGHLKSLAKWVAFKYLTPKHTMTSIGLLLGLSASYLGTMDTLITRLLSVHVTRMLPPGAAELNLSPLTQTTGIMGIGLLYCSSQHRRMSEVMLSEIENNDIEEGVPAEQTLRDEGYRLAAGFALGFINLGQGKRLHGLHDINVMERLLTIAIGTKNVNLVHILDRATSGATIAFALIYMKTNDETIARKIDIPDTLHQFDYVRPDIFLLRTLARHLIMWSSIHPSHTFIRASLPKPYCHRTSLASTHHLTSNDLPFFNILAGLCLSLGLRFAGSHSPPTRDLLTSYLDQFIRLTRLPAPHYDAKLTRNAVRNCQDVTALALAAVMSGSGDLTVFRRLRSLHGRADADTPYGSHLAAHMAIGILFLGGGKYTLGTSDVAVAGLLCAFYPVFPTAVGDNQAHLQAFRHLWVLGAEERCVVCRDVETGRPVSVPVVVTVAKDADMSSTSNLASGAGAEEQQEVEERHLTSPTLLPDLNTILELRTQAKGYWDVTISFAGTSGQAKREEFSKNHLNIYLKRRAAYDAPRGSVFVSELQVLAEEGGAPGIGAAATAVGPGNGVKGAGNPFEWLWGLEGLRDLDGSERALVLGGEGGGVGCGSGSGSGFLKGTVVDTRLELEHSVLDDGAGEDEGGRCGVGGGEMVNRDQLWQLRLLFAWVERLEREEAEAEEQEGQEEGGGRVEKRGAGNWLRRDVIERLRWRVWKMGAGVEDQEQGEEQVDDED